jgi:hypothetical protein
MEEPHLHDQHSEHEQFFEKTVSCPEYEFELKVAASEKFQISVESFDENSLSEIVQNVESEIEEGKNEDKFSGEWLIIKQIVKSLSLRDLINKVQQERDALMQAIDERAMIRNFQSHFQLIQNEGKVTIHYINSLHNCFYNHIYK